MNNIIVLIGPTATGKTKLSLDLSKDFNFEIINADLFSIYKGLDIGTAKPTISQLNEVQHFLIDIINPEQNYNVSEYCSDVSEKIKNILSRGKSPLIVGGSMMYVYQLLNGLNHYYNISTSDKVLIKYIQNKYSNIQIYNSIKGNYPHLVKKINKNDSYRIEKLLERLISKDHECSSRFSGLYNDEKLKIHLLYMNITDRDKLREMIKVRSNKMIEDGLVKEVIELRKKYQLSNNTQSMKAIGYKEVLQFLDRKINENQLLSSIILSTQQLAKRQITWKNKFKINYMISCPDYDYNNVYDFLKKTLD